jgi:hypothetical protein
MDEKWRKNDAKTAPKRRENGAKKTPKRRENGAKTTRKRRENGGKTTRKWRQRDAKNGTKMAPNPFICVFYRKLWISIHSDLLDSANCINPNCRMLGKILWKPGADFYAENSSEIFTPKMFELSVVKNRTKNRPLGVAINLGCEKS